MHAASWRDAYRGVLRDAYLDSEVIADRNAVWLLIEVAARETARRHPDERVYLWVFEQNLNARRFYDQLGGHEAERILQPVPGGDSLVECRVVWDNPAHLLAGVLKP